LSISDVEKDVVDFRRDIELTESVGVGMPAVELAEGEPIPIALGDLVDTGTLFDRRNRPLRYRLDPRELTYWIMREVREGDTPGVTEITQNAARSTFRIRLVDFLATRVAAVREYRERGPVSSELQSLLRIPRRLNAQPTPTPGCTFNVSTNSYGLRVFWTGAYRVSRNFFGHPTSPCTSVLQSGTYIFGVDGGAYTNIQWDWNAVVRLPGSPFVHLNK
jgi:hypothetical protein